MNWFLSALRHIAACYVCSECEELGELLIKMIKRGGKRDLGNLFPKGVKRARQQYGVARSCFKVLNVITKRVQYAISCVQKQNNAFA